MSRTATAAPVDRLSPMQRWLRWTEWVLLAAGLLLLGVAGAWAVQTWRIQQHARESLRLPARPVLTHGSDAVRPTVLTRGMPIGELSIERVHLSAMVLHGADVRTLRHGPGHIESTALPGEPGNVAIAGHRDSFFRPLRDVRVGDAVRFDTERGRFEYVVTWTGVVSPSDVDVLDTTETPTLTLVTCYPFWLTGPAPDRFVVRAEERARPLTTDAQVSPTTTMGTVGLDAAPPAPRRSSTTTPPASDDLLVRRAVERFRVTYNARLTTRERAARAELLAFEGCEVLVHGAAADARCYATPHSGLQPARWHLAFARSSDGWSIRSVETE